MHGKDKSNPSLSEAHVGPDEIKINAQQTSSHLHERNSLQMLYVLLFDPEIIVVFVMQQWLAVVHS